MKEAKYEDAVSSFQKALDQSLGRIRAQELDVCYYKALAQYKSGDTKAAIKTYDGLVDYDKKKLGSILSQRKCIAGRRTAGCLPEGL